MPRGARKFCQCSREHPEHHPCTIYATVWVAYADGQGGYGLCQSCADAREANL